MEVGSLRVLRLSRSGEHGELRTMDRMREDIASVVAATPDSDAAFLIGRGRSAQPALRIAATSPQVRQVVLWAPIVWVDELYSKLKAEIMTDVNRNGFAMIDGTRVGPEFLHALNDPTDEEVRGFDQDQCGTGAVG